MNLGRLKPAKGATRQTKRLGRGSGSGTGKTAGKGHKGQKARSGAKHRPWFEGGQMPLQRRLPKRGFTNIFRREFQVVNVGQLGKIKGSKVDPEILFKAKLIRDRDGLCKILGEGEIKKAIEVKAHAFSQTAVEKLEAAGGKVEVL